MSPGGKSFRITTSYEKENEMDELLQKLAVTFDVDEVEPEQELAGLNWDSMAMLGVIALGRSRGKKITADQLKRMVTIADVVAAL